jgi:predicted ArsR family transcriptional regulator
LNVNRRGFFGRLLAAALALAEAKADDDLRTLARARAEAWLASLRRQYAPTDNHRGVETLRLGSYPVRGFVFYYPPAAERGRG